LISEPEWPKRQTPLDRSCPPMERIYAKNTWLSVHKKRAGKGPFQRLCWSLFPSFHFPYLYRIHNTVYPHFSEDTYNANVMRNNLFTDCVETRGRKSSWKSN
jgi:hypothetical protein